MISPMKTGLTIIALSLGLQGCMSTSTPAPEAELSSAAPAQNEPLMRDLFGPSDLDSAILQAQMFRRAGDYDGATRTLSQLVLVAPDDPRVLGEYGKTLVAKGQTDDAIAFLTRAIELNPGEWSFYSAQGVAFDQAGNFRAANMAYQRALTLQPGEPSVLSNAGLSRMQAGDLANAEILLSQALERGGPNARISRNLAMVRDLAASQAAATAEAEAAAEAEAKTAAEALAQARAAAEAQRAAEAAAATPVQASAAPPPSSQFERQEIPAPALRTSSAVQALADDPKVYMQTPPEPDAVPAPSATAAANSANNGEAQTASAAPRPLSERLAADAVPSEGLRRLAPTE
jgi:Flp pilus assembly protein TadD